MQHQEFLYATCILAGLIGVESHTARGSIRDMYSRGAMPTTCDLFLMMSKRHATVSCDEDFRRRYLCDQGQVFLEWPHLNVTGRRSDAFWTFLPNHLIWRSSRSLQGVLSNLQEHHRHLGRNTPGETAAD